MCRKNEFTTIGVVGSIGKTSTKLAIAEALSLKLKVQYQSGNYNDLTTVPLVFFGQHMPALFNPLAWLRVFIKNEVQLKKPYPFDVVVLEIGTDGPGQIAAFGRYIHLDIAVITAITPEHMEFFTDIDEVAKEELSVVNYTDKVIINSDFVADTYRKSIGAHHVYSLGRIDGFQATDITYSDKGTSFTILKSGRRYSDHKLTLFSDAHVYSALAAAMIWDSMGLPKEELHEGLAKITAVVGRMQLLEGIEGSTIIDDSYNSSPEATKTALDTVYRLPARSKVVLLGNMNELGAYSKKAHTEVGEYCNPKHITEVITLGPDANQYLAEAARKKGCVVSCFDSPYEAGNHLKTLAKKNTLFLVKGSQNSVFAEEAIKSILKNPSDQGKLVRQSKGWMKIKKKQFGR